jgi:hypothetical protein
MRIEIPKEDKAHEYRVGARTRLGAGTCLPRMGELSRLRR